MDIDDFAATVRQHDYERYVTTLFSPRGIRRSLWILYTLNYELERIRFVVKDPMMRMIRLQWWHDEITKMGQGILPTHDVLKAAQICGWQTQDLHDLVEGFAENLQNNEEFQEKNSVPLLKLACQTTCFDVPEDILIKIAEAYEFSRNVQRHSFPPQEMKLQTDRHLQSLATIPLKIIRKNAPLLVYFIAKRHLRTLRKTNYDIKLFQQKNNIFMLPLYLFIKWFN